MMSLPTKHAALSISIRPAVLGDGDAIVELWRSAGMLSGLNDPREDLWFALKGATSTVLVSVDALGTFCDSRSNSR